MEQGRNPGASGEFSRLLHHLVLGAKVVAKAVSHAGLMDVLGEAGGTNQSGDRQKKLDVYANERYVDHLVHSGLIAVLGSEECDEAIPVPDGVHRGNYVVTIDPLDGSSNIDCNGPVGTLFSIYKLASEPQPGDDLNALLLQPGNKQLAAGYVLYGPSTMLVMSTGNGVNGFTLDPQVGEFFLTHPDIQIPERGRIYSVNEGNSGAWEAWTSDYVAWLKGGRDGACKAYKARYIGSMVADVHRTLLYGGVFLYPGDRRNPDGKLRLVYEAFPMAFLVEHAGGSATDGVERILDKTPTALHQKVPVVLGSRDDVADVLRFAGEAV